jgi:hypothetical protein
MSDLYLRSATDKSVSNAEDLRLRSDADKTASDGSVVPRIMQSMNQFQGGMQ